MYNKQLNTSDNQDLQNLSRKGGENNSAWLTRALKALDLNTRNRTALILIGGRDQMSFRLRLAQSHFRRDMLPSYWSDCLLAEVNATTVRKAYHVPLVQPYLPFAPYRNGVVEVDLKEFANQDDWPNIALLAIPTGQKGVLGKLEYFVKSRDQFDSLSHLVRWLAFTWGTHSTGNPVHEGLGLPSACMAGVVCAAAGIDLTPGIPTKAACPETIWSAAKYWFNQVSRAVHDDKVPNPKVVGCYVTDHCYDIEEHLPQERKSKAKPKTAASNRAKKGRTRAPAVAATKPPLEKG